jgi:cobyrinic acid a,c-diamide synthase
MKTLLIAGDRSGSGKTSITLAIAALLSRDRSVQTFKVGMDYIDPSYLTGVTGRPCRNLDSFVMAPQDIRSIFDHGCRGADIALVEGVRGLFEGAEALTDSGSTASIAKALDLNVVLVVSARSITRSAAAIVKGFSAFDPGVKIRGVILNNVSGKQHIDKAVTAVEHYCDIPVIGAIPRHPEMELTMRHLGLVPYLEGTGRGEFDRRIEDVVGFIGQHLSIEKLLSCAGDYVPPVPPDLPESVVHSRTPRIAIALDEAFNFYYADLFDTIRGLGGEFITFSPVHDRLPDADGFIIGGGYPELFLDELEKNENMREAVREISRNGTPIYAECGGLMYLTDAIILEPGWQGRETAKRYNMCGVFPGETHMPARRVVTYVEGNSRADSPVGASWFRGHEFHYSDVRLAKDTDYAYCLSRGYGICDRFDGAMRDRTIGSYTHLHPVSSRAMFAHFVDRCREEKA